VPKLGGDRGVACQQAPHGSLDGTGHNVWAKLGGHQELDAGEACAGFLAERDKPGKDGGFLARLREADRLTALIHNLNLKEG
jgi:hypothetical protein